MKFDFWFELPKALSNVNQENLCQEDIEYGRIINQTLQVHLTYLFFRIIIKHLTHLPYIYKKMN